MNENLAPGILSDWEAGNGPLSKGDRSDVRSKLSTSGTAEYYHALGRVLAFPPSHARDGLGPSWVISGGRRDLQGAGIRAVMAT
jgi:hypothetical protein